MVFKILFIQYKFIFSIINLNFQESSFMNPDFQNIQDSVHGNKSDTLKLKGKCSLLFVNEFMYSRLIRI